ncbi:MAG: DUF302 domain-containing protein [Terracidiphilus sp.]
MLAPGTAASNFRSTKAGACMQVSTPRQYANVRTTKFCFDEAVAKLESALKKEGFAVLCQIDIRAKLKEKLGIEFPRYVILGACNPALAHQALERDMNLGLPLPCNAVVYEAGGKVRVGLVDATRMLSLVEPREMEGLAREVNEKLQRALDSVAPLQPAA